MTDFDFVGCRHCGSYWGHPHSPACKYWQDTETEVRCPLCNGTGKQCNVCSGTGKVKKEEITNGH